MRTPSPQDPCSETDSGSSTTREDYGTLNQHQHEEQEELIVFDVDRRDNGDSESETSSISSEYVQTGDAYWDAILLSALTEAPVDQQIDNEEDSEADNESCAESASSVSDTTSDGDSSLSCCSFEDEDNEWTNLTKDVDTSPLASESPVNRRMIKTVLSVYLWNRDYECVAARLESNPEEASQEIDLSIAGAMSGEEASKGLPLHLACAMRPLPPLSVFELLLKANPAAARHAESKWRMLPLHFAVNLSNQDSNDGDCLHQPRAIQLLVSAYPAALDYKETCQGRTALQLAASSTLQSIDGKIPPASANVLQVLMDQTTTVEALWESDMAGETAYDIAQQASKASMTVCFAGMNWQVNPLLQLLTTAPRNTAFQQRFQKKNPAAEDDSTHTDTTSATMSVSSGSMTTHGECQQDDERYASNIYAKFNRCLSFRRLD